MVEDAEHAVTVGELIELARYYHANASDRRLAVIAREAGHKIGHSAISYLRGYSAEPSSKPLARKTISAIAFLSRVPESVVYDAACARTPTESKEMDAAAHRQQQKRRLQRGQKETLISAVNKSKRWTTSEDLYALAFMERPGARVNDLARELGRTEILSRPVDEVVSGGLPMVVG